MTTWPLQSACKSFYGTPGTAAWESANLVSIPAPWTLYYNGKKTSGIRVHRKCADSLRRVLDRIWERCGRSQAEIDRIGMSNYGGGFNFRPMRTGSSLSMHSYGCATDFDPARNALGDKTPAMDRRVIEEFEREGWEWGGHWGNPDGMHFQAAWTRAEPKRLAAVPAPAPVVKPVVRPVPLPVLRKGAKGAGVEYLQWLLKLDPVDGDFGSETDKAVRVFQRAKGLTVDGVVGKDTWRALEG